MTRNGVTAPIDPYMVGVHVRARLLGLPILSIEARVLGGDGGRRPAHPVQPVSPPLTDTAPELTQALNLWSQSADVLHELRENSARELTR